MIISITWTRGILANYGLHLLKRFLCYTILQKSKKLPGVLENWLHHEALLICSIKEL